MKNKYAICYSLYDNYKISESNLYYYKGVIDSLSIKNRNFDVYIDTTKYCYDILIKIIQQEELDCSNVYYNIHNQEDLSSGMLWRFKTMIDICQQYEIVGINDSDNYFSNVNLQDLFNNNIYGVYTHKYSTTKNKEFNVSCWGLIQFFQGCHTYISYKNLKSDYNKLLDITNRIFLSNIYKPYEFDEFFFTSILHKELINNNYGLITPPEKPQFKQYIRKKLSYLNNDTYSLNNKILSYNNEKPNDITKNDMSSDIYKLSKNKNLLFNIQRYMLDYINELDINCYE
jgi:hypothetical protein